jgi:TM2 domain-containing membrane protein YozV
MLLSLFLGALGVHRFYLGRPLSGIFYLVFFWTLIPALLAFLEVFRLGLMSDEEFHRKYD